MLRHNVHCVKMPLFSEALDGASIIPYYLPVHRRSAAAEQEVLMKNPKRGKRVQRKLILALLILLIPFTTFQQCKKTEKDDDLLNAFIVWEATKPWDIRVADIVHAFMGATGTKGVTVTIVDDQTTVFSQGFGHADLNAQIPVTPKTIFLVGSISKLFTATAVMQLHEKGSLNIDYPFTNYVPGFSMKVRSDMTTNVNAVTPRHMLSHYSGMPSDFFHDNYTTWPPTLDEYATQFSVEYLAAEPNKIYSYSNVAFALLGLLVEKQSGQEFKTHVDAEVLGPLGMTNSSFTLTDAMKPLLSKGYYPDGREAEEVMMAEVPAGMLRTNGEDMAKFMKAILAGGVLNGKRILAQETLDEMMTVQNKDNKYNANVMGLGWWLDSYQMRNTGKVINHGGGLNAFNSMLYIFPERKLGVFISANTVGNAELEQLITRDIVRAVFAGLRNETVVYESNVVPAQVPFTAEQLVNYPGLYAIPTVGTIRITALNGGLNVEVMGRSLPLSNHEDGIFRSPIPDSQIKFFTVDSNEVLAVNMGMISVYGWYYGQKLRTTTIPDAWKNRLGTYKLTATSEVMKYMKPATIELKITDGILYAKRTNSDLTGGASVEYALEGVADSLAVFSGLGRNLGETLRVESSGSAEILHFQGAQYKK